MPGLSQPDEPGPFLLVSLAMANTKPYVQIATICEHVLVEQDGVVSAIRVIDVLRLDRQEIAHPPDVSPDAVPHTIEQVLTLWLLVALRAGSLRGEFKFSVSLEAPNGQVLPLTPEYPVVLKENSGFNYKFRFGMPNSSPEGMHWFIVQWQGEELTRFPLQVKHGAKEKDSQPN